MENTIDTASPLDIPVMHQRWIPCKHWLTGMITDSQNCPHCEIERLRDALLDTARRVEALKRECGMDPESRQAIRNSEYMSIALNARAALLLHNAGNDPRSRVD